MKTQGEISPSLSCMIYTYCCYFYSKQYICIL